MFHNSKITRLVYPLALWTNNIHLQPSKYRTLFHNSKRTRSVYPSALPLQPLYQSTSPHATLHATLHAEIYKPTFKTLTGSSNVSESWKETTRKSKENSSANAVKWRQSAKCVEWAFPHGQPTPSPNFRASQCIPASAIMQFRRNIYEYSTKKLRPSLPYAKWTRTDFRIINIWIFGFWGYSLRICSKPSWQHCNASLKSTVTRNKDWAFNYHSCTCNPNKSYVKMPVSPWCYIPTSLPQEQAAKTKMLSVVRIQQKQYLVLSTGTSRLFCLTST